MLQPYDLLMLAVVVGAMLFGVWKGVIWQIAALASVVVSAAVAVHSSAALAPHFGAQEPWNRFLAMLVLYLATAAGIWLVFRLVAGIIDRLKLNEFDRQLGTIFGLAKGILYCVVITFFAVTLSEAGRQAVLQSRSGVLIARGIRDANPILPNDVRNWLGKYIDELDEKLHAPLAPPGTTNMPTSPFPFPPGATSVPARPFFKEAPKAPATPFPSAGRGEAGKR
jgi:membrane protein required for colicin V production